MPGLENGSSLANAFTWDPTQYPGGTRVFGATSYNQSQDWWALYLLAGARRDGNFFYQLLQIVGRPFTRLVRRLTPRQVADRHVPVLNYLLLLLAYAVVTVERISLCVHSGMETCR